MNAWNDDCVHQYLLQTVQNKSHRHITNNTILWCSHGCAEGKLVRSPLKTTPKQIEQNQK